MKQNSIYFRSYSQRNCSYSLDPYSGVLHLSKDFFTQCAQDSILPVLFFKMYAYQFPALMMDHPAFLGVYYNSTSVLSTIDQKEEFIQKLSQDFVLWLRSSSEQCLKPWTYRQFDRIFESRAVSCNKPYELPIMKGVRVDFQLIEPGQVQRIDYVIAGQGGGLESMWGHSMFRLVLCESGQSNGQCSLNKNNHLMLQFGGLVNENSMNYLAGIVGGYQGEFNILPFDSHVQQYTHLENRTVYDYPLKLSKQQLDDFMLLIRQMVLSPQPNYSFLTKNCATQSLLLTSILLQKNIFLYRITTPNALLSFFQKQGLAEASGNEKEILGKYKDDLEKSFQENFYQTSYFSSFQQRLNKIGMQNYQEDDRLRIQEQEKGMNESLKIYKTQWDSMTQDQRKSLIAKSRNAAVIESEFIHKFDLRVLKARQDFFEAQDQDLTKKFTNAYIQTKNKLIRLSENSKISHQEYTKQRDQLLNDYNQNFDELDKELNQQFESARPDLLTLRKDLQNLNDKLNRFAFLLSSKL